MSPGRKQENPSESDSTRKLIALGEIVSKVFCITDREEIDSSKRKKLDSLVVSATEGMKKRDIPKTEKVVKSILTEILLYHETRADFMIKNHTRQI